MLIAHRIALDPNNEQRTYFARAAGSARFAYNWGLAEWQRQYKARSEDPSLPAPSEAALRRQLNAAKREQFPWMFDVTKFAVQEAIIDLGSAFRAFFEKRGRYPRFKKKGIRDSFCRSQSRSVDFGSRIEGSNCQGSAGCACARPFGFPAGSSASQCREKLTAGSRRSWSRRMTSARPAGARCGRCRSRRDHIGDAEYR